MSRSELTLSLWLSRALCLFSAGAFVAVNLTGGAIPLRIILGFGVLWTGAHWLAARALLRKGRGS